jgi:xanthine dehydrogenase YagR molybdenum-binding subunit
MTQTRVHDPRSEAAGGAVGRPVDRLDGTAKTTGAARYSAEYPYPDLAYAALVYATISRGWITRMDTAAALAVPGVLAVITHQNAPAMKPPPPKPSMLDLSTWASPVSVNYLNTDELHWNGQPVAVVVADTLDAARHAADLVRVTYDEVPATVDFNAEKDTAAPQKGNMLLPASGRKGNARAALGAAPVSVDLSFSTPTHHHNAIEPHATTAVWDGDRLTVYDATQNIDWTRSHLALRFGIPTPAVRVISLFVGGAFGGKAAVWPSTVLTALAARVTGRPVRMMLTREGVYRTVGGRSATAQRVALGAAADGRLTSLIHTSVARVGRVGGTPEQVTYQSRHLYDAQNILLQQNLVELDLIPNTFMRAPGEAVGTFAVESAMDELAYRLGIDPIELRMRNEPDTDPLDGKAFSHRRLRQAYELGASRFGWARRTSAPGSMRDGRWLVGMGVATAYHPASMLMASVTVRLSADGTVLVRCGLHEMGMGAATVQAQIAADALGVPLDAVRVEYGDSTLPVAPQAASSTQTATIAASLLAACDKLKASLLTLAHRSDQSPLRRQRLADLRARDGGLYRADEPAVGETYAQILSRAGRTAIEAGVGSDTGLGAVAGQMRFFARYIRDSRRWVRAASGAQFCEVRVDPDTGEVRVSRWLGVFDIGTVVNPKTAGSQLRGGIVMGIGAALAEETLVDPHTGRIMNTNLADYHVPVHADIPPIDVHCLGDPDPTTPLGLLGAGEVGITGAAAAVANAVHHATGKRVTDLPITPDRLL